MEKLKHYAHVVSSVDLCSCDRTRLPIGDHRGTGITRCVIVVFERSAEIIAFVLLFLFLYQVVKLDKDGFLEPDIAWPYFPLREDAFEAAHRGTYWTQLSAQDLVVVQVVFSSIGVATLLPDVLSTYERGEITRYIFKGTLFKEYRSQDDHLLYSVRKEKLQIKTVVV